jgi:hypothetical protein
MDWKERLGSINANLDDLQSGVERGSRAADGVRRDVTAVNGTPISGDLVRLLTQHAIEIEASAIHQRGAMRELRQNIARLGRELSAAKSGL